jgi:hypothetical protein
MQFISGELLSADNVIATVQQGVIVEKNTDLLPLFLLRTGDFTEWLADRAIDTHRTNSRILKRALRLGSIEDTELVLKVHAATITDTYWFRREGESLSYEEVRFKQNHFDKLALYGDPDSFNQPYSPTPEITNVGSFEKCWRQDDGRWWMVKQGNDGELFSELFVYRLGESLGLPMAEYQLEGTCIKTPDFTLGATFNFETAKGLVGDNEDYLVNFRTFYDISPQLARQYLEIIYMDSLCFNMDRHTQNYGVLREVESGQIFRMAPNFDNNIALFSRGIPANLSRENDKLLSLFYELLQADERAAAFAKSLPVSTEAMTKKAAQISGFEQYADAAVSFVMSGSQQIQSVVSGVLRRDPEQMQIQEQGHDLELD